MAKAKKKSASVPSTALLKDEKRWRAESDARILMDHAAIQADRSRMSAARAQLKQQQTQITKAMGRSRGR